MVTSITLAVQVAEAGLAHALVTSGAVNFSRFFAGWTEHHVFQPGRGHGDSNALPAPMEIREKK